MPKIQFLPSGREIRIPAGTRLIDAIRRAGLPIASPCGDELICAKCAVRILKGPSPREAAVERDAKARNRISPELRLACALRVRDDLTLTADYWGELRDTPVAGPAGLLLVDHGSRDPAAHSHLEALASRVQAQAPSLRVAIAHLELAEPSIATALAQLVREGVRSVAIHPLLLAPGKHLAKDIPRALEAAALAHPELSLQLLDALGDSPALAELIVTSVREQSA